MTGNHLADQGDKEYQDKGNCPDCGKLLDTVDWCEADNIKCTKDCPSYPGPDSCDCVMIVTKLTCKCGYSCESE